MLTALESGPATLAGLVTATGLARPTAHRLAVALEHHRLVARDLQGRFVLGPRLAELSVAAGEDRLLATAGPVLARLRDITGESSQLWRRQGDYRVCVAAAERPSGLRDTIPVGLAADHARRLGRPGAARLGGPRAHPPRPPERRVLGRRAVGHPPARLGPVGRRARAGRGLGVGPGPLPLAARSWPRCRSAGRSSGCPASRAGCTPPPSSPPPSGCRSRCAGPPPSSRSGSSPVPQVEVNVELVPPRRR